MLMVSRGVGVLLFAWLFVSGGVAAQLDPEVLVDRYLVRVEGLIAEQNYTAALEVLDDVFSIQQENNFTPPDEFHFVYAQVALSAGSIPVAIESVTRYLTVAGQSGEFYTEALELWDRAEAEADRRARVELEAQARREAERRQAELEAERRRQAALEAERRRQAALEAERRRQAALGPAVALLGVERDEARVLATRCPRLRIVSDLKRAHFLLFKTFSLWLSHDSRGRSLGLIPTARQTESIDRICERLPQSSEGLVTVAEGNGTAEESRTERSGMPVVVLLVREGEFTSDEVVTFAAECRRVQVTQRLDIADFIFMNAVGNYVFLWDEHGTHIKRFRTFRRRNVFDDMCEFF